MIHEIPLQSGDVVVEYGPGTGPFTSVLRKFMPPGVEYIGIEYDKELHQNLVRRFPGMRFHHGSAEETPEILASHGLGKAKFVISGLPFANMPRPLQEAIFESTRAALSPDGTFRTFTYFFSNLNPGTAHFRQLADDHFGLQHRTRTILRNFPPARVLSYSRPVQREIDMNC
jgi:phospholipid N-methyltransferase